MSSVEKSRFCLSGSSLGGSGLSGTREG
jgi:hypothetical protein